MDRVIHCLCHPQALCPAVPWFTGRLLTSLWAMLGGYYPFIIAHFPCAIDELS
jgi:hypothetical protein